MKIASLKFVPLSASTDALRKLMEDLAAHNPQVMVTCPSCNGEDEEPPCPQCGGMKLVAAPNAGHRIN